MFQKMLDGLRDRRETAELEGKTTYCRVCGLPAEGISSFILDADPASKEFCYYCRDMVTKGFDPETGGFPDSWFTSEGTIEFSQTLTGEQATVFESLLKIGCKRKTEDCDGPWCTIRKQLQAAFGVTVKTERKVDQVDG